VIHQLLDGLAGDAAFTTPGANDARLVGRTYAIPFDLVWQAALGLISGGLHGWQLVSADDQTGIMLGRVPSRISRLEGEITVRILLDPNAQTRVDALATTAPGKPDLGVNARRIGRFFHSLDAALARERGGSIGPLRLEPATDSPFTPVDTRPEL
jgi:hypothetical protein